LLPFDPDKSIILETDASFYGIAGVWYHLDENNFQKPVFVTSKTLNDAHKKYPHHEKEALAIIHSLQKFHKYLHGKEFTIYYDNKPVVSLFSEYKNIPTMAKMRLQRWVLKKEVIYSIPCSCGKSYIGETGCTLETRVK
jgi:hypothetical protein